MKKNFISILTGIVIISSGFILFEEWTVSTVCGANDTGHQYDGNKDKACFTNHIGHCASDGQGNLFVVDEDALRKVSPDGSVNSWFGGHINDENGDAKNLPTLNDLKGICIDKEGVMYVSDGNCIKKINSNKEVELYAGNKDYSGSDDGVGAAAEFYNPSGLCMDKAGNIYVADANNRRVRKIAAGTKAVTTLAGEQKDGTYKTGAGKAASFFPFYSVAVDSKGNVYVPQNGNRGSCVAKISPAGIVTTFAGDVEYLGEGNDGTGKAAHFNYITSLAADAQDNIIVGEKYRVRKITTSGVVTTLAGANEPQWRDAAGAKARFGMIGGIAINPSGEIYVSDLYCIRKMAKQ